MIKKTFQYGEHAVTLETGSIARQASGAVLCSIGGTVLLVAAVCQPKAKEGQDFFPLTINYQEKAYANGRIPGGFFKREGRPTERETLICRLIDRPIRPLFPKGFLNEIQVTATVVSVDPEIETDIVALIGASAALSISGVPFSGPLAAARVGYQDGNYLLNPTKAQLADSSLDLVVAGTHNAVLMVESEAKELSEEVMLGAVTFGHEQMQVAIEAIKEFALEAGKPAWDWQAEEADPALVSAVADKATADITEAYQITEKLPREARLKEIKANVVSALTEVETAEFSAESVKNTLSSLEKRLVRDRLINGGLRIDGRNTTTVRDIRVETGLLPRTHGSALFTRGETQALVVATLGTERDAQMIDTFGEIERDKFMLHYNFPPYCVGETGFSGGPKRREIGHGKLAKRAIQAVLPDMEEYPYVLRVVSEITESNGSSSMASVCGTSLALMDAGVPIKAPVAGIAMGLIKEGDIAIVLSDIMGAEDHLGDMDFKVAGTAEGITALQMDIKIDGITHAIMKDALAQAKDGREHILAIMNQELSSSREEMSEFAPRITTIKIHPDKIRDVIGKGGATIRSITEETGASIDINDDGLIKISAVDHAAGLAALKRIELITADVEVGQVYEGKVVRIVDFGAFVNVLPGKDGLLHISEICAERVEKVTDKLEEGQQVNVKVLDVDRQGRVRLSMKALL